MIVRRSYIAGFRKFLEDLGIFQVHQDLTNFAHLVSFSRGLLKL